MEGPPPPPLGPLRPAQLTDIPRLARIATHALTPSELFTFYRPYHVQYLRDTGALYKSICDDVVQDPGSAVLVVKDECEPAEGKQWGKGGKAESGRFDGLRRSGRVREREARP